MGPSDTRPGVLALLGSGETAPTGRRLYERLLEMRNVPARFAILETPAGFQLNSGYVAGRVAEYLRSHLQNHHPEIDVVPARRKGRGSGTDSKRMVAPLLRANYIFMGPGSPTYAVRHLAGSRAWHSLVARHRLGANLCIASAAAVGLGEYALPVYEIYKAGEDLHWTPGLNLLGPYGLRLTIVAHWNNTEGGAHHDTSRCYMGRPRMSRLMSMLPDEVGVLGIDEHTALIVDFGLETCSVMGEGSATLIRGGRETVFVAGSDFSLGELGSVRWPAPGEGIPDNVWQAALGVRRDEEEAVELPEEIATLIETRERARSRGDWETADVLRGEAAESGYRLLDTPDGPRWERTPCA